MNRPTSARQDKFREGTDARRRIGTIKDLYPTRREQERILDRLDPVIFGDGKSSSKHALSIEELKSYEENGFVVIPDVFSKDEVELLLREVQRLAAADQLRGLDELILEPDSDERRSIFSPHRFSDLFRRLSCDHRLVDRVRQVLDSDVYIHHARINIKAALNGKSFPWHSDFETWHAEDGLPRCRVLSAWVMLSENSAFNGPLYLIAGSHKYFVSCAGATPQDHHRTSLRKQEYGVPSLAALQQLTRMGSLEAALGAPGALILHEGNTMHGSSDNISPQPRTNLFFVYNSVFNTPHEKPFSANRFRPEMLGSRDFTAVDPLDIDLLQ
jgi:ectoine hydroxylase